MSNNDSVLKKEFKEKDVNRIRNLVTKKHGDATQIQVGYQKIRVEYKEGDIWEENEKQWTIQDGIKQTFTKLDDIKREALYPLLCPKCTRPMKTKQDKEMFTVYRNCFSCVIELETKLKVEGKYEDYVKALRLKNALAFGNDYKVIMEEVLNTELSFVTEDGDIEKWAGGKVDKVQILKDIDEYIKTLTDSIGKV
tara:strand:- start:345 stop:929 length:585 start_codon:yes stop_codon:yes gene_type:complete